MGTPTSFLNPTVLEELSSRKRNRSVSPLCLSSPRPPSSNWLNQVFVDPVFQDAGSESPSWPTSPRPLSPNWSIQPFDYPTFGHTGSPTQASHLGLLPPNLFIRDFDNPAVGHAGFRTEPPSPLSSGSPLSPSSPSTKWFIRAFDDPYFGDVGFIIRAEEDCSRSPTFEWKAVDSAYWGTRESIIDLRDKDPDATYAVDKRNNAMVLKRMQESVQNYQRQQAVQPMASRAVQINLQDHSPTNDHGEYFQKITGFAVQAGNALQSDKIQDHTAQYSSPNMEKSLESAQNTTTCRIQDLVLENNQQKSTKSMAFRITCQRDSTNAKRLWRMQKLVPNDDQPQPLARETESRTVLQPLEPTQASTSQKIENFVKDDLCQRPKEFMVFKNTSNQSQVNTTNSRISPRKLVPSHAKHPSAQVSSLTSVKPMAFSTRPYQNSISPQIRNDKSENHTAPKFTTQRTRKRTSGDVKQSPVKNMAFMSSSHQDSLSTDHERMQYRKPRSTRIRTEQVRWYFR